MILLVDAGSRQTAGSMIMDAWKFGIEVEQYPDYQIELSCTDDIKLNNLMSKFPNVTILHKELVKEI